jgi:hypothetical protein
MIAPRADYPAGGVIDNFTEVFTRYIDSGFGLLGGEVAYLASTRIVIDITLAGLFWAWGADEDVMAHLIKKTLYVGFFGISRLRPLQGFHAHENLKHAPLFIVARNSHDQRDILQLEPFFKSSCNASGSSRREASRYAPSRCRTTTSWPFQPPRAPLAACRSRAAGGDLLTRRGSGARLFGSFPHNINRQPLRTGANA